MMAEPAPSSRREPVIVTPALLRGWPLPATGGDKESKGRLLVVGDSDRTPGAVRLAAEAALRVGAGKVQVATTTATAALLAVAVPEALVVAMPTEQGELTAARADQLLDLAERADAVLIGPGLGTPEVGCHLLEALVPRLATRLVVDALGTAFVTRHPEGLARLGPDALLTPNSTELAELLGRDVEEVERDCDGAATDAARMAGVAVLAGGAVSFVARPSVDAWALSMGVPGAAVAGSGDVAGAVAGLLARGAEPAMAAVWGAYLHARCGERLAASVGRVGYLAREIARELPVALSEVEA